MQKHELSNSQGRQIQNFQIRQIQKYKTFKVTRKTNTKIQNSMRHENVKSNSYKAETLSLVSGRSFIQGLHFMYNVHDMMVWIYISENVQKISS